MAQNKWDLVVVGSGAAGLMAAITAGRKGKRVVVLEKLKFPSAKLKATGGGRCNLTNTLSNDQFMPRFGRQGRFMEPSLSRFDHKDLITFFAEIGVESHAPDGYRVFPITHNSQTIIDALITELEKQSGELHLNQRAVEILNDGSGVSGVKTETDIYHASKVVLAVGGLGYPKLGATGDGYAMAKDIGHKITKLYPAMMPLRTKERWTGNCTADTIPKVLMKVDIKGKQNIRAQGDLIFTKVGVRGPIILDFSREITPLLDKYDEVPLLMNLTKGMNQEEAAHKLKAAHLEHPKNTILSHIMTILPESVSRELLNLAECPPDIEYKDMPGSVREHICKLLAWMPLTINGHDGFKMAMITRGGISLKEISPDTMESKLIPRLYFCGEVMDLDGPCGGYNLTWSFASGHLAGLLGEVDD